jgi:FeS assembly protein IscX
LKCTGKLATILEMQDHPLYWEPTYEIVLALMEAHPDVDGVTIEGVGYHQLLTWIIALPNFADDPAIVSEELLRTILREWYEEMNG